MFKHPVGRPKFCYFKVQNSFIFKPTKKGTVFTQKMSPAEPDFLRKENSWFFFGFSVYVIWISAWILRDSWCIISMSIFFDAAEKWKKSKSWIEDSKAAVPHLLLLRIWRTSQFIDCLILANFWPLPSPHKFTSHPTNSCQFSILCNNQNTFRKSSSIIDVSRPRIFRIHNVWKWYKMRRLWVIFQKFSPMQFPKYFFWSRATIEEITGCFRGCRR